MARHWPQFMDRRQHWHAASGAARCRSSTASPTCHAEITAWRRDLHAHPELHVRRASHRRRRSPRSSRRFGCDEVVTGIGRTGVVGVIRGRKGAGGAQGDRAARRHGRAADRGGDRPALQVDRARARCTPAAMTATPRCCSAPRSYLAETRNFAGTAVVIFQPAEEGGGGGRAMVEDGLMERFGIEEVYGMHNYPGLPVGEFAIRPGPMMAAADRVDIDIEGRGGHAARPHQSRRHASWSARRSSTSCSRSSSRNVDPLESAVISICMFQAGTPTTSSRRPRSCAARRAACRPRCAICSRRGCARWSRAPRELYGAKATLDLQARLSGDS